MLPTVAETVRMRLETGPARVSIVGADGVAVVPVGALRDLTARDRPGALDMDRHPSDRSSLLPLYERQFVSDGVVEVDVVPGRYVVRVERGLEFVPVERVLEVVGDLDASLVPERWVTPNERGWWSADFHVHRPAADAELLLRAEELNLGVFVTGWTGKHDEDLTHPLSTRFDDAHCALFSNHEDERGGGAWIAHGLRESAVDPDAAWWHPSSAAAAVRARASAEWIDAEKPTWWESPVLVALGLVDSIGILPNHFLPYGTLANEAWGRPRDRALFPGPTGLRDYLWGLYYRLLNCGFRLPASAGSASGVMPAPPGHNRVYVQIADGFSVDGFYSGLRAGRSFVTNGPLLEFTVGDASVGDAVEATGDAVVPVRIRADHDRPVERVELVADGAVIAAASGPLLETEVQLSGVRWLAARAFGSQAPGQTLAHTSPIYVRGATIPVAEDAAYFVTWIDELVASVHEHPDRHPTDEARAAALALFAEARAVFAARAG